MAFKFSAGYGGVCATLLSTGDYRATLIPDNSDDVTSVISALETTRDAFGFSFDKWLSDELGPWGAMLVQI